MQVIELEGVQVHIPVKTYMQIAEEFWNDLPPFKKVLFMQTLFLLTGVFSTLSLQLAHYQGAAGSDTLLPAAATFLGMCLAFFSPKEESKEENGGPLPVTRVLIMGSLEFFGCAFSIVGLNLSGSGIYQVVYSSIVIWIALMSKWFLKKPLSRAQWVAVLITTFGVSLSALGSLDYSKRTLNGYQTMGICITLSTFAYGSNYIVSEHVLSLPDHPSANHVQTYTGLTSFLFVLCYLFFYTIPNWHTVFSEPVKKSNGNLGIIMVVYVGLIISAFLHSFSYYKLVKQMGSVSTGILQSLRAVCVFFLSSLFYCEDHPEQCLSKVKILSAVVVIGGVLYYTYLKKIEYAASLKYHERAKTVIV